MPPALDARQVIPEHILYLCSLNKDHGLNEKCPHVPLGLWSLVRMNRFFLSDVEVLVAKRCSRTGFSAGRSTMHHARAEKTVCESKLCKEERDWDVLRVPIVWGPWTGAAVETVV